MEDTNNSNADFSQGAKTSSTTSKENDKTTGDSQVQEGAGVIRRAEQEKAYEKSEENQEYIQQANNNTETSNASPVQDGQGMTM